jgi:Fur family ferric uptake transcriptional regulator
MDAEMRRVTRETSDTQDDPTLAGLLRGAGLRVTGARLAVLEALQGEGRHRDVQAIARAARLRLQALTTQAVYDNLNVLVDAGLVRRIQPAGHPARYEARVGDNHHHVVCRGCGVTADVDCAVGYAPCLDPSQNHGFLIQEAEVIFWGLCPRCQQAVRPEPAEEYQL